MNLDTKFIPAFWQVIFRYKKRYMSVFCKKGIYKKPHFLIKLLELATTILNYGTTNKLVCSIAPSILGVGR